MSIIGAFVGVGSAAYIYTHYADQPLPMLKNSFYINELYWDLFAVPLRTISNYIVSFFEPKIFEGIIRYLAGASQKIAGWLQKMQSGQIRSYVAWMAIGTVLIIAYLVF